MRAIVLVLLAVMNQGFAQEVKKKRSGNETFEVLKSDQSVRHGAYIKKDQRGIVEKGQYDMNQKSGVWEFYGLQGDLEQKYDYCRTCCSSAGQ